MAHRYLFPTITITVCTSSITFQGYPLTGAFPRVPPLEKFSCRMTIPPTLFCSCSLFYLSPMFGFEDRHCGKNVSMKTNHFSGATIITSILALVGAAVLTGCPNGSAPSRSTGTSVSQSSGTASPVANSGGMDHSGMKHGDGHAMGTSGIEALKPLKGKEFDIAFLSQMIAHHQAAVKMAQQAIKTATKTDTKTEAQKVVDAQTKEIAQMTNWLKEWYNTQPSKEQQALVNAYMQAMMSMPVTSDQMFYEMMIPHHQGAIDMSELVPERSKRPEVKKLAQQIIRDQKAEIAQYHQLMGHSM